jgi:hypothetical protein
MCIVPLALAVAREDITLTEKGCGKRQVYFTACEIAITGKTDLIVGIIKSERISFEPFV